MSLWWNKFWGSPYALRVESSGVSLWRGTKQLQSQPLSNKSDTADFYAELGLAITSVFAQVNINSAKKTSIHLGQGLVQHSVISLDVRQLNSNDTAAAVQSFWGDANSGSGAETKVAWQIQRGGKSIFSSCCSAELISNLQTILSSVGWKIDSISTHAAQVWNTHRSQVRSDIRCILILQDDVLSMGLQRKGVWLAWVSESCFDTDWTALSNRAARFLRSTGICNADNTPKSVYAPHIVNSPITAGLDNWTAISDKYTVASTVQP